MLHMERHELSYNTYKNIDSQVRNGGIVSINQSAKENTRNLNISQATQQLKNNSVSFTH